MLKALVNIERVVKSDIFLIGKKTYVRTYFWATILYKHQGFTPFIDLNLQEKYIVDINLAKYPKIYRKSVLYLVKYIFNPALPLGDSATKKSFFLRLP